MANELFVGYVNPSSSQRKGPVKYRFEMEGYGRSWKYPGPGPRLDHLIAHRGECRDTRDPMGKDNSDAYEQQQIDNEKRNERRDNIKRNDPPRDNREVLPQYGNRPSPQERKDRPLRDVETEKLIHELYQRANDEENKANAHFLEALLLLEQARPIAAIRECGTGGGHMQEAINLNTEAAIMANTGNTKTTSNQNK
ncbi:MAG: hypothetical protein JSR80_02730 [Verrucomicrobia bacterium]|nr:hypothetical protein [Verrucomicrobiota bacterium]